MTDGVIKGDGTSRLAKASGWPETYEGFKALAESSGIPLDLIFNSSGWQQLPTFLSKATLLQDFTAQLIGLNPDDDPTVDDALLSTYLAASDASLVKIKVYETGTTKPIGGVGITGVTSMTGGTLYADSNGDAVGLSNSDSATISIDTRYIDLTSIKSVTVSTPKKSVTSVTLYATRVTNTSGKTETFTTSTQRMFTNKVKRVDVHCVGGGAGGGTGGTLSWNDGNSFSVSGGRGGQGGKSSYANSVSFIPNNLYTITVGAAGKGSTPSNWSTVSYGTNGGASSALGITALGGVSRSGGTGAYIEYTGNVVINNAASGSANTVHRFGESSLPIAGGGDGGGGGAHMASGNRFASSASGADPNGGDGGGVSNSNAFSGSTASSYGGGGGGGATNDSRQISGNGGDGYKGVVYIRWWY